MVIKRDKLINHLKKNQIEFAIYYDKAINDQIFFKRLNYKFNDLTPIARMASKKIISLPMNIYLTKNNLNKICSIINNVTSDDR